MDLSIIIVNWNVKPLLKKCLQSIYDQTTGLDFEIIVIDNASSDQSAQMVAQDFPRVDLIASNENLGFAKANNMGLAHAQGNYILFMNPDMELVENSFKTMHDLMVNNSDISISTCQLVYPDLERQNNIKNNPGLCDQVLILLKLHHIFKPACLKKYLAQGFDYFQEQEVKQIMGAFVFCENDAIKKLNGWDSNYWLWWEDLDLCKRAQDLNYKIIYTPKTKVIHYEGKSFEQQASLIKQKRFNKGMRTYFKKHHDYLAYLIIAILSPISLLLAYLSQVLAIKPTPQSKI
jgi:GT2 family glycosyltransferase